MDCLIIVVNVLTQVFLYKVETYHTTVCITNYNRILLICETKQKTIQLKTVCFVLQKLFVERELNVEVTLYSVNE